MKRRSTDPTNQNTVPVLGADSEPLMPTRPSRARRLMEQGQAKKYWRKGIFHIQMTDVGADDADVEIEGVQLNVDPGAKATGLAVVSDNPDGRRAHALIELRHRGTRTRNRMDRRRAFRRGRRGRLRNRQPRFDNRTRPDGWLAPSIQTRLANTETWVRRLAAFFPITQVRVETARFDTQIMQDTEIEGRQYQQGELAGWQLRSYVFHRDGRRCAYCGTARAERYELDHIIPRSRGGTNRVSNLVVSCHDCNVAKGNMSVEDFLAYKPARLAKVKAVMRSRLAGASQMNIIVPALIGRVEQTGLPVSTHDAYTTSWTRNRLGIPKTHVNDALCVGTPDQSRSYLSTKCWRGQRDTATGRCSGRRTATAIHAVKATATTARCRGNDRATPDAPDIGTGAKCSRVSLPATWWESPIRIAASCGAMPYWTRNAAGSRSRRTESPVA